MSKKHKTNIDVFNKLKTPQQRTEELIQETDPKTVYLPKSIRIEDIDTQFFDTFENGKFILYLEDEISSERQKVPAFFMSNERWAEFSKTWKFSNQDKNVIPPYITVRRGEIKKGTYAGTKNTIPNRRTFTYVTVPYYENGRNGYEIYSIPQPTAIDITYEIKLFSRYMGDVNAYIELFLKNFSDLQFYIKVNEHFMRCEREDVFGSEGTLENIDGDRYHVSTQTIRVMGYLQDANDFQMVKSFNRIKTITKDDQNNTLNENIL